MQNEVILVVGGTGSFGTNFIRHILKNKEPNRIRIYSRDEHKQEDFIKELNSNLVSGFIGDVRDKDRLRRAMDGVNVVVHAAALKRVQSCEYNPFEAVKTNIIGSMNVVDCAIDAGVEKVLAISTDKAVSPLNLYGATKMCMEKLLIHSNNYRGKHKTKICCVRYGNVAKARGSVIPIWREQHFKKQPITITNTNSTRFWLDLNRAVNFVVESLERMDSLSGGEIMVPKIPSFKIIDLYKAMFEIADFTITGNRVGDKIHEILVSEDEMTHTMEYDNNFIILPEEPMWEYHKPEGVLSGRKRYDSVSNEKFLTIEEIKEKLAKNA